MARAAVIIQRVWPDGDCLTIKVPVAADYPDAIAEAKATALSAYAIALEVTIASDVIEAAEGDGE